MNYKEGLMYLKDNTIEYFKEVIEPYKEYLIDIKEYNKKYTGKVEEFFTDNKIDKELFFDALNKYRELKILNNLNIDNIILNFKKYFLTDRDLQDRLNKSYSGMKPIFSKDMLYTIRNYLFDEVDNQLTLQQQNEKLHKYPHFDAGMKKIKSI